jgi:hypothetical protein
MPKNLPAPLLRPARRLQQALSLDFFNTAKSCKDRIELTSSRPKKKNM